MSDSNICPLDIPLHRLIKRHEAAVILQEFEPLLPGGKLALVGADGHLLVGTDAWPAAKLADLLAHARDDRVVRAGDLLLQPLLIKAGLAGAVVFGSQQGEDLKQARALRCLGRSLTLLLNQALERRDLVRETLDRYREINLLYDIGETIGGCLDLEELPQLVLGEAERIIKAGAGMVLLPPNPPPATGKGDLEIMASFGAMNQTENLDWGCGPIVNQVYDTGRPAIVTELPSVDAGPFGPVLCAPLKTREQVLGVILLRRLTEQPEFTAGDEKLLVALAGQAAIAMETARLHQEEIKRQRLEEELAIGRQIQLSLLPEACPAVPGWEFAALYRPARLVGGDLYDFIELPGEPRQLGMVIADVTGKGVPAALFMAFSRTVFRTLSISSRSRDRRPAAALRRVNQSIVRDIQAETRLLLSAFYATLDTHSGRLTYANGGHNWPLWLQAATGEVRYLDARGIMLGVFKNVEFEEHGIDVAPGDVLVFYTDGVTEARDVDGQMFEEERLRAAATADLEASAQGVLDSIIEAVEAFTDNTPQSDDLTLFVIKRQRA